MNHDDERLVLWQSSARETAIPWQDITCIRAYKQDMFNPQIVNLLIETRDGEVEIQEQDVESYRFFHDVLERRLGCSMAYEDWWQQVTQPSTHLDEFVIVDRSAEPAGRRSKKD
ncbi:MAG: hypothetical protein ACOCXJ_08595 [Planctomycetota bacterium]